MPEYVHFGLGAHAAPALPVAGALAGAFGAVSVERATCFAEKDEERIRGHIHRMMRTAGVVREMLLRARTVPTDALRADWET